MATTSSGWRAVRERADEPCSSRGSRTAPVLDVTPPEFNVRTRVHEYGGGSYLVAQGTAYCVNFADQRIYRVAASGGKVGLSAPEPVTPPGAWRYADFDIDTRRERLICVREDHSGTGEPINALVAVPLAGPQSEGTVLVSGADFYSTPRLSPDGSVLAWLSWSHPLMPWDGTELWTARLGASGALEDPVCVAGGSHESIYQPGWSPQRRVVLRERPDAAGGSCTVRIVRVVRIGSHDETVVARSASRLPSSGVRSGCSGLPRGHVRGHRRSSCRTRVLGNWRLATVDVESGALTDCAIEMRPRDWIAANGTHAVLVAGSATRPDAVVRIDLRTGAVDRLRDAASAPLDAGLHVGGRDHRVSNSGGSDGARVLLSAPQQGLLGAFGRTAASHRHQPWRSDGGCTVHVGSADSGTGRPVALRWRT